MAKQIPDLNEITSALSNDDLMIIRDVQSGVDYRSQLSTLKDFLSPKSIRVYDTTADMVVDTDLVEGDRVRTFGDSSTGDGGAYLYEVNPSNGVALDNGLFAKRTAEQKIGTPQDFGAVGDGVTDDTSEVQSALDNLDICIIDKPYSVTSITIPENCYVTCIGDGKFISVGATDSRTVTVDARVTGFLNVDGNDNAVNTIYFQEGLGYPQYYERLQYQNIRMVPTASTTNTGVTMFGDEVYGGPVIGKNLDQNGYPNPSFPQGLVTGGGLYVLDSHYLENGCAGLVPTGRKSGEDINTASGKLYIKENHTVSCTDNSAYLLGGYVTIGHNTCEEEEESVQIGACRGVNIGKITTVGRCLGAFNLQNVLGDVNIGEIEGKVPVGTDPADYGTNCATIIGYVRSGNTSIGTQGVYIGRASGVFQRAFALSNVGTVEAFHLQSADVELQYNPENNPVNKWSGPTDTWLGFNSVKRLFLGDCKFTIRNRDIAPFETFTSGNSFSWSTRTAGNGVEEGWVDNLQVYLIENDGTESDVNHVRGPIPTDKFHIYGGYWHNFGSNTYWVNPRFANYVQNSINSIPQSGYWHKGEQLINRNFEYGVDDVEKYHNMATGLVSGSANWQEVRGTAPQLADSTQPPSGLVPDVRGQIYVDTSTSPQTLWYGFGLSAGDWIKLNNEP